jgi:hypothetical protein
MIIGTHDSTAFQLNLEVSFWDNNSKWEKLRKVGLALPCVKSRIKEMTLTQDKNLTEQLTAGSRAFDIRVAYSKDVFYCCHTFATITLEECINQINKFVTMDKITILLRPDYDSGHTLKGREEEMIAFTRQYFKNNIKIYYHHQLENIKIPEGVKILNKTSLWFNVRTTNDFVTKYNNITPDPKMHIVYAILSMDEKPTFENLFCNSIEKFADKLNPLLPILISSKDTKPYMILIDFI